MSEGGSLFTPYAKINSKWITDIIVSVKLLESNTEENLGDLGYGDDF